MTADPKERPRVDLRAAINAVSDVVQNRPKPLRDFDQIHMKAGDMVLQSEIVANWADGKRLAFIGDGDAISVCVAYLKRRNVLGFGPERITVFDFDERTVNAVMRFAKAEQIEDLDAVLYNCLDAFPITDKYDCFYTNPPWGAHNEGGSVNLFVERGIEAIGYEGDGMIVIADDDELDWPKIVLSNVQGFSRERGFYVSRMQRKLHSYHLDENLQSCNLYVSSLPGNLSRFRPSAPASAERLENFYGRDQGARVHYVRERKRIDYGKAHDDEYELELKGDRG
ncbi:MAG: bis-aminopropyl spermidine synthase family protein [Bosea sp.]|uniref:bis-aminopropyl spermidine synthase family protein n=1 Tax=Bosea sp. (in: a-proteobacteria) TaxID=1871050 RepID=UPI0023897C96|nr:bis-aminopropyl spermidine synthase family protein [Bosea sp. (in: a-proteobacteria)]MCP4739896.1 bis-aminopropyl spermidine synthase family protein [Bosea sp. (in: a-proteobacteria)]